MSLRPASRTRRVDVDPVLLALYAVAVPAPVLELDEFGSPCLRVAFDRVRELPEVVAAKSWASGDTARLSLVRHVAVGLTARLYATSSDALNPPPY